MATASATTVDLEIGENTPLLPKQQDDPISQDFKDDSTKEKIVASVAAVSFATSLLSLILADGAAATHPSLYVSGVLGALIAPYAALQQQKITETDALNSQNHLMTEQVQQLQDENTKLQRQVQELEETVRSLQVMQETLDAVRAVEGKSVTVLEQQLEDSKKILYGLNKNSTVPADVLQTLLTILLACNLDHEENSNDDDDKAVLLHDNDIEETIEKLESINGVDIEEDLFRKAIVKHGRSVNAVMEVIRNLLSEDIPEDQKIFIIHN